MKSIRTLAILFAATALSAPAFADDDERYYDQNRQQFISYEKASEAALQRVGGGYVKDVEFEHKRRSQQSYFDVEIVDNKGNEFDVRVDAKTGKVLYSKRDW